MTEHSNPSKVVVLGGGYAGTLAANRLRTRADVDITLVNPRPEFVERIRLHQFVARTGTATLDYGTLLGEGVHLVVDTATRIDTAGRTVRLASGRTLDYDYLVYAVGSTSATPAAVPGAAELALSVAEFESARRLRARLEEVPRDAPVTVVGGGLTGIETAAELAERGRRVTLVCGRTLAPSLGAPGRRYVAKWARCHRTRGRRGDRGPAGCRRPCRRFRRRRDASERADRLGGGVRRAGAGGGERAAHRRPRPAAHRRDADQPR